MKQILIAAAALAALGSSAATLAQTSGSITDDTQVLISQIQTDKRTVMLTALGLSDSEMAAFTPIYDEYQAENKKRLERASKVINKYAANYDTMNDKTARDLMKEAFKVREERTELLKKYAKKLERKLPATKVLRFVQVENKLNALLDAQAAALIPLAK